MDYAACNIIYVDQGFGTDRISQKDAFEGLEGSSVLDGGDVTGSTSNATLSHNVKLLLQTFSQVYLCTTGKSCIARLAELHDASLKAFMPTLVLVDIPPGESWQDRQHARTPSPTAERKFSEVSVSSAADAKFYGISLLQWISSDIQQNNLSRLVVPIAVVEVAQGSAPSWPLIASILPKPDLASSLDQAKTVQYLDAGAVDVLTSPLIHDRLPSLAIHAYAAYKNAMSNQRTVTDDTRGRKRSWVGLDDNKPYAYLREAMVSGLMDGICRLDSDQLPLRHAKTSVTEKRQERIREAVASWSFSAHEFNDEELMFAGMVILQHALAIPQLDKWRLPAENLMGFLEACRLAYNSFVPYHNFRHVIDVLQACFHFLVQLGTLPPYPEGAPAPTSAVSGSPIAALLRPFDALTLLITAIGHDVGHPGVNNAFLVTLNAPLAQLYNDRSVLESFHCAAYSQILRRHWPAAFAGTEMRQLMISSILATDMGLHFDYMKKLGFLQEKLHENKGTDGWNGRTLEEYRTLACALLIKCADVSNVARKYDVACQWTMILTDEFARQASMELDLGIPSALFAPPVREIIELGHSQIGFMNMFAIPLFQGVTDVMPAMRFAVDELQKNRKTWEERIEVEQAKRRKDSDDSTSKGTFSPKTFAVGKGANANNSALSEGLPPPTSKSSGNSHGTSTPRDRIESIRERQMETPSPRFMALSDLPSPSNSEFSGHLEAESLVPPIYTLAKGTSNPPLPNLQLPAATASAPGLIENPEQATNDHHNGTNGVVVAPSLSTEAVVDESANTTSAYKGSAHVRSSNATDTSLTASIATSIPGGSEWPCGDESQATSATTEPLPISPSTQATSIMSEEAVDEKKSFLQIPLLRPTESSRGGEQLHETRTRDFAPLNLRSISCPPPQSDTTIESSTTQGMGDECKRYGSVTIMQTMRSLTKKPSRSRFRFWKKRTVRDEPTALSNATATNGGVV